MSPSVQSVSHQEDGINLEHFNFSRILDSLIYEFTFLKIAPNLRCVLIFNSEGAVGLFVFLALIYFYLPEMHAQILSAL